MVNSVKTAISISSASDSEDDSNAALNSSDVASSIATETSTVLETFSCTKEGCSFSTQFRSGLKVSVAIVDDKWFGNHHLF